MNYTDYKTGKSISRDQYIANGVDRGKLLITEDCGCVVIQDRVTDAYIVYCDKHEAAPDMYEMLREILFSTPMSPERSQRADNVLAKAEGKEQL